MTPTPTSLTSLTAKEQRFVGSELEGFAADREQKSLAIIRRLDGELIEFHALDRERMERWKTVLGWTGPLDEPHMQSFADALRRRHAALLAVARAADWRNPSAATVIARTMFDAEIKQIEQERRDREAGYLGIPLETYQTYYASQAYLDSMWAADGKTRGRWLDRAKCAMRAVLAALDRDPEWRKG